MLTAYKLINGSNSHLDFAGTAWKVLSQFYHYYLCYPILLYNLLSSPDYGTIRSRDILDVMLLIAGQELTCHVVGVLISFTASVFSGTRHSFMVFLHAAANGRSRFQNRRSVRS
jgi:hypothetical protein